VSLSSFMAKPSVLVQLDKHPKERDLIGKIILAYGEIEVIVMDLVTAALNGDNKTALRTLFRLRSENNRLQVADAIARPWFTSQGLEGHYSEAMTAAHHCMGFRNHYAHCQWVSDEVGQLRFGNLEDAAKSTGEKCQIILRPITRKRLQEQYDYFSYAEHMLLWVTDEYRLKTEQKRLLAGNQRVPKPKRVSPPKPDSRGEEPTPR
jgi:hypothetical protein